MKITILPGDGIGPEVCRQAANVLTEVANAFEIGLETEEHLIGGVPVEDYRLRPSPS